MAETETPPPVWRVKSRPCPFYQHGRCLFQDSCNFMHTVSAKVILDTPSTPPTISIRSPPRSPRLSGLLLALKDVIGEDPDDQTFVTADDEYDDNDNDDDEEEASKTLSDDTPNNWSAGLPTLLNDSSGAGTFQNNKTFFLQPVPTSEPTLGDMEANMDDFRALPFHNHHMSPTNYSLVVDGDGTPPAQQPASSPPNTSLPRLLSPVDLSNLHLSLFNSSSDDPSPFLVDDTWKTPQPLHRSPPIRSPALSSTLDFLASPFRSPSTRLGIGMVSPRLGPFRVTSPLSAALSPSTEDVPDDEFDLDSPDNYRSPLSYHMPMSLLREDESIISSTSTRSASNSYVLEIPSTISSTNANPDFSYEAEEDEDEDGAELDSYGSTAIWESAEEGGPTAVFLGVSQEQEEREESESVDPEVIRDHVTLAIRRHSATPMHFLSEPEAELDFVDEEMDGHSSLEYVVQDGDGEDDDDDGAEQLVHSPSSYEHDTSVEAEDTAQLAYLAATGSPRGISPNDGDTLNSLYDVYNRIDEPQSYSHSAASTSTAATTPTRPHALEKKPSSSSSTPSLRERVFTPPPSSRGRDRSGTVTAGADSPTSAMASSPVTSLGSMKGRESPHAQDLEVGKKVPFGFRRNSFALGRAKNSSLIINRTSRMGAIPTPPPERDQEHEYEHEQIHEQEHDTTDLQPATGSAGGRLKPLRLSTILHGNSFPHTPLSPRKPHASTSVHSYRQSGSISRLSKASSVTSGSSLSNNPLLSSPVHNRSNIPLSSPLSPSPLPPDYVTQSAPLEHTPSWCRHSTLHNHSDPRSSSRFSEPAFGADDMDLEEDDHHDPDHNTNTYDETIRRAIPVHPHTAPVTRASSEMQMRHQQQPLHALATPRPTLMFAIASDDVEQVRQVLESGEAGPNDSVGPLSALEFVLTNEQLVHKMEMVKMLLAFGADSAVLRQQSGLARRMSAQIEFGTEISSPVNGPASPALNLMDLLDPATRYYVDRAEAPHAKRTSALIHRSFFRPLTRVRFELIGQDRALEQLFRVLSVHSRNLTISPIVVFLCGPSGHGKSLLARKFGSLLDVPTHTVNMTTLRTARDLWQSYSMSPYEVPTTCTLAEFLVNNEGKRCIVVLDEIEKTEDEKTLWSLLLPWEAGRCSFESNSRAIDVRNVIWLGTSNIGHDLVFQHHENRERPDEQMTREEYDELMVLVRSRVSQRLGASVLSRVTAVLPFVPFTIEERKAISSEALHVLDEEIMRTLSPKVVDAVVDTALASYNPADGARSLYRAVSNQLVDMI